MDFELTPEQVAGRGRARVRAGARPRHRAGVPGPALAYANERAAFGHRATAACPSGTRRRKVQKNLPGMDELGIKRIDRPDA